MSMVILDAKQLAKAPLDTKICVLGGVGTTRALQTSRTGGLVASFLKLFRESSIGSVTFTGKAVGTTSATRG